MPTILTKPPNGIALMPYSVSPLRNDQSVGPNPAKYRVTFMPNALAVHHVTSLMEADRHKDDQGEEHNA